MKNNENYYLVNFYFMNENQNSGIQVNDVLHSVGIKYQFLFNTISNKINNKIKKIISLKEEDIIKIGKVIFIIIRSIVLDV